MFMDYCKFGDIATWDSKKQTFHCKWELKKVAKFFRQAAEGLQYSNLQLMQFIPSMSFTET